jgi:hypothetical protein
MITVDILIWQFVRIMVYLEGRKKGPAADLYALWRAQWREVDGKLAELGQSDPDAFARMMMSETVALHCASAVQLAEMQKAVAAVIAELTAEIAKGGDDEHLTDLAFERDELTALNKDLDDIRAAMDSDGGPDGDEDAPPRRKRKRR